MAKEEDPLIPWGYGGKKIRLSQVVNDPMFQSLASGFKENILKLITENPEIGIGGADREDAQVAALWKQRYEPTNEKIDINNPNTYNKFKKGQLKEFNGQIYKLKKGMAPSATPNASWHTGGFAVDLIGNTELAGKLASKYGLNQVTSTGENWHFQPAGMPDGRRVIDFLKKRYAKDITKEPLSEKALKYINENFASNAPSHPAQILSMLDALIGTPTPSGDETPNMTEVKKIKGLMPKKKELSNKMKIMALMPQMRR